MGRIEHCPPKPSIVGPESRQVIDGIYLRDVRYFLSVWIIRYSI